MQIKYLGDGNNLVNRLFGLVLGDTILGAGVAVDCYAH